MRVVLDTNTLVSALLFTGTASRLVPLWQSQRIVALVSKAMLEEYLRVLAYPKFRLQDEEIRGLIEEEVLPFFEPVVVKKRLRVVKRDPTDDRFLECAVAGRAGYVISGDRDLVELGSYHGIPILPVGRFLDDVIV